MPTYWYTCRHCPCRNSSKMEPNNPKRSTFMAYDLCKRDMSIAFECLYTVSIRFSIFIQGSTRSHLYTAGERCGPPRAQENRDLVECHHDQPVVIFSHDCVDFFLLVEPAICILTYNNTHGRKYVIFGSPELSSKWLGLRVNRVAPFIELLDISVRINWWNSPLHRVSMLCWGTSRRLRSFIRRPAL